MDFDQKLDPALNAIKEKLNKEQIKLWLPPYYTENEIKTEELERLASKYLSEFSLPPEICLKHLQQLQLTALENLRERDRYRTTGQASLKIRISSEGGGGQTFTITIELSRKGLDLKNEISKEIVIPVERFKVICRGKLLKDDETLEAQGIKHNNLLMVLILAKDPADLKTYENNVNFLDATKKDVLMLENCNDDYFEIADQSGKRLKLPANERKALVLAMTLHEKGRAALKKEDYALALVLLLEADKEFSECNSALLKSVDNYGVLSLDIAWCYLNLQSVTQLPNAEERLKQCESSFQQSYGTNLERLVALKGGKGNESALFVRLHLLQAIVLYHQNKINQAKDLLKRAEEELNCLKVDDNHLSHLMEIGYTSAEARLALRESRNDLNTAVTIIENKRAERQKNEEAAAVDRKIMREKRKLGKCLNGNFIEPEYHKAMMNMGFSYEAARWALAQSNNNIYTGVNMIQDHPELMFDKKSNHKIMPETIEQLVSIGYDKNIAKIALKKHQGDVNKAVEELSQSGGMIENIENYLLDSDSDESEEVDGPSTSKSKSNINLFEERAKAYSRVAEGISNTEDDHLDLNLEAEIAFLEKYKQLLFS